jgi:acid phosphatase (class A)
MMNFFNHCGLRCLLSVLASVVIMTGCAGYGGGSRPASVPEHSGHRIGYLSPKTVPNSLALLPPPPTAGSVAFSLDEEYSRRSFALRNTAAWTLAASDADLTFPHVAGAFSCALNAPITEKDTPYLYMMFRRIMTDAHYSTAAAKKRYKRARPFLLNKEPICTPEEEAKLGKAGSYPSSHNVIGMAMSLILTGISPEQTDAILARGRAFGFSRIICNVHWHSDTLAGRHMGAYLVARLNADPGFRADLEAARTELEAVRVRGLKPVRDCSAEAAAIALQRSLSQ